MLFGCAKVQVYSNEPKLKHKTLLLTSGDYHAKFDLSWSKTTDQSVSKPIIVDNVGHKGTMDHCP